MKSISIKSHESKKDEKDQPVTTLTLLTVVLDKAPEGGFTVSDMKSRFTILDKIGAVAQGSTVIELEDAEYNLVKDLVRVMRWGVMDKFIVDFAESFN